MLSNRMTAALFAIAIASSLVILSSGSLTGPAFAAKKTKQASEYGTAPAVASDNRKDNSPLPAVLRKDSGKSHDSNAGNTDSGTAGSSTSTSISAKDLKSLSKCQSSAASDGDLTQAEVIDCYHKVF
jgi:hypothetical protein